MGLQLGCSERYLQSVFNRDIGLPPKVWLRTERMVVARRMLMDEELPEKVAAALGFASLNGFRREFVSLHGVSPLQFQKEMKEAQD